MSNQQSSSYQLEVLIEEISSLSEISMSLGLSIANAAQGRMFLMDIFSMTIIDRSSALSRGFSDLIKSKNFISAAPLIRMQLDNCMRYYAAWLVEDPNSFITNIMSGQRVDQMKDKDGHVMKDWYLKDKLAGQYPEKEWITNVYEQTSGFIHLSDKHFHKAISKLDKNGSISFNIGNDEHIPDDALLEAIITFIEVLKILNHLLASWLQTKKNCSANL